MHLVAHKWESFLRKRRSADQFPTPQETPEEYKKTPTPKIYGKNKMTEKVGDF